MLLNPSIHIGLSSLVKILEDMGFDKPVSTAETILRKSVPYAIKDRYIVQGNEQFQKKAKKLIAANTDTGLTVEKFNQILTGCRVSLGHTNITPITKDSTQFVTLKEVAKLAYSFTEDNAIGSIEEGCKIYVMLGLEFMTWKQQFGIGKFKYYDEKIRAKYEASVLIKEDPKKIETRSFYEAWREMVLEYGSINRELKTATDYVYMIYARIEADNAGAYHGDWLKAQFEALSYLEVTPNHKQLIGEVALGRYWDYMGKGKKKVKKEITINNKEYESDFNRVYFEKLRQKNAEKS